MGKMGIGEARKEDVPVTDKKLYGQQFIAVWTGRDISLMHCGYGDNLCERRRKMSSQIGP